MIILFLFFGLSMKCVFGARREWEERRKWKKSLCRLNSNLNPMFSGETDKNWKFRTQNSNEFSQYIVLLKSIDSHFMQLHRMIQIDSQVPDKYLIRGELNCDIPCVHCSVNTICSVFDYFECECDQCWTIKFFIYFDFKFLSFSFCVYLLFRLSVYSLHNKVCVQSALPWKCLLSREKKKSKGKKQKNVIPIKNCYEMHWLKLIAYDFVVKKSLILSLSVGRIQTRKENRTRKQMNSPLKIEEQSDSHLGCRTHFVCELLCCCFVFLNVRKASNKVFMGYKVKKKIIMFVRLQHCLEYFWLNEW